MKIANLIAVAALVASTTTATVSFAQDNCTCLTEGPQTGRVGSFLSADGSVTTTGARDYINARVGTPISIGSEISVGAESSAEISVGTCTLSLVPNSLTRVSAQEGGRLCVASAQTATTTASYGQPLGQAGRTVSWVPLGLFGGLAGGAAILSLTGQGNDPVSQ
jgi:hypothetical protein